MGIELYYLLNSPKYCSSLVNSVMYSEIWLETSEDSLS